MTNWVTTYGYEFSSHIYSLLNKFVENTFIRDGHVHIAESMQSAIARSLHQRNLRRAPPSVRAQMAQDEVWGAGNFASSFASSSGSSGNGGGNGGGGNGGGGGSSGHGPSPNANSGLGGGLGASPGGLSVSPSAPSALSLTPTKPTTGFPEPKLPKSIFELSMTLDDVDEEEIARQLTCLDAETFHMLKTRELIKNAWLKNRGKKAKRLVLLLNAANGLTKWVVDTLLVSTTQPGTFVASQPLNPNLNLSLTSTTSPSLGLNTNSSNPTSTFNTPGNPTNATGGTGNNTPIPLTSYLRSKVSGSNLNANAVLTAPAIKRLTKLIARWVRVAEHLRNLNNFHSLLAIWTALRSRQGSAICDILKKELPKHAVDVRTSPLTRAQSAPKETLGQLCDFGPEISSRLGNLNVILGCFFGGVFFFFFFFFLSDTALPPLSRPSLIWTICSPMRTPTRTTASRSRRLPANPPFRLYPFNFVIWP